MAKYVIDKGKVSFGSFEGKEIYILHGVLLDLEYIGRESKLSFMENELRKLSIKNIKKLIKAKQKRSKNLL